MKELDIYACTPEHYWYLVAQYWANPRSLSGFDVKKIEYFQRNNPKEACLETRTKS